MIGVKTLVVLAGFAIAITVGVLEGKLGLDHLETLSAGAAFAIGLFASAATAMLGFGWRPELPSRAAVAWREGRPRLLVDLSPRMIATDVRSIPRGGDPRTVVDLPFVIGPVEQVRELPAVIQRALFVLGFAAIALGAFDNTATARIASVPAELTAPSHADYCGLEPEHKEEAAPAPVIEQPVDQAGCALVKRAVELGYKKDLGNCAPKVVKPESPAIKREREVCTKRQLDEPFLHFTMRRVVESSSDVSPVASAGTYVDDVQIRTGYLRDFLGDIRNSVTGAPHASHHIWVNLPDPHPPSSLHWFTGHVPCMSRFADLPLWPRWSARTAPGLVFEHVLGQLLFATRFGTPASCSDYTIHWGAPADACARLAANPAAFLDASDALAPIRAVLDRRKRQLALRALAAELHHPPTLPEPPPARFVVSAACFIVGGPVQASGRELVVDGQTITLREVRMPAVHAAGAGPIEVYVQLALLLGGTPYAGPAATARSRVAREPVGLSDASFPLVQLEPLVDADPFIGGGSDDGRAPLDNAELVDVYPLEHHVFAFVDAFRRAYLPQRGRL